MVITGTYGACEPPLPYWLTIWLSTLNACPGMEKLFVIRWVVPLMVITPTAATTTQNRVTSALWRRTKRVSAGIVTSGSGIRGAGGRSASCCSSVPPQPGRCARRLGRRGERLLAARPGQRRHPDRPHPRPVLGGQQGEPAPGLHCGLRDARHLDDGDRGEKPVRAHQRRRVRHHPVHG